MNTGQLVVGLVALERLAELLHAARNTRRLRALGAVEHGRGHYPFIVALHAAWLAALLVLAGDARLRPLPLALFAGLQLLRLWVIATLGPFWTTRILSLPTAPLVRRGPYRFLRHPNYLVVALELPLLLLAFGAWRAALAFGLTTPALLSWRIRTEEAALAPRRAASCGAAARRSGL